MEVCLLTNLQKVALNSKNWLFEEYYKTNLQSFENLVNQLVLYVNGKISSENFYNLSVKCRIAFEKTSENFTHLRFDPSISVTIVSITENKIRVITSSEEEKQRYILQLRHLIVHEDTHKQQFDRYEGYCRDYKNPSFTDDAFKLNTQADVDYFSQTIEADAYGRDVGSILKDIYPDKSANWIFENVIRKNVSEDILEYVNVYRDPRIPKKAFQHFWRTLYDYLQETEKEILEQISERMQQFNEHFQKHVEQSLKTKNYNYNV